MDTEFRGRVSLCNHQTWVSLIVWMNLQSGLEGNQPQPRFSLLHIVMCGVFFVVVLRPLVVEFNKRENESTLRHKTTWMLKIKRYFWNRVSSWPCVAVNVAVEKWTRSKLQSYFLSRELLAEGEFSDLQFFFFFSWRNDETRASWNLYKHYKYLNVCLTHRSEMEKARWRETSERQGYQSERYFYMTNMASWLQSSQNSCRPCLKSLKVMWTSHILTS